VSGPERGAGRCRLRVGLWVTAFHRAAAGALVGRVCFGLRTVWDGSTGIRVVVGRRSRASRRQADRRHGRAHSVRLPAPGRPTCWLRWRAGTCPQAFTAFDGAVDGTSHAKTASPPSGLVTGCADDKAMAKLTQRVLHDFLASDAPWM
jgi:hypothetical protein